MEDVLILTLSGKCRVDGCNNKPYVRELCAKHVMRVRRNGTLDARSKRRDGTGGVNVDGYRTHWIDGRLHLGHRLAAEQHLGRVLRKGENVHHRNGQRLDNTVGPCLMSYKCECSDGPHNLEMWSKTQPSGQRIPDKLQWAHELIATYDDAEIEAEANAFADSVSRVAQSEAA